MEIKTVEIPHLQTAHQGMFYELEKHILDNQIAIESWFREVWKAYPPLLTSSVDLRNAGFKIAPVDTNIFPAGFNNINPDFFPLCIQAAQNTISAHYPDCKSILIIPESHTRNPHYYQSLATLHNIIQNAGYEVKIGSLIATKPIDIEDHKITLYPVEKNGDLLHCDGMVADLIVLNNDLSDGTPELLTGLRQPIDPPAQLGWSFRSKSNHFTYYREICEEFAKLIDIDMWHLFPLFLECGKINFVDKEGMDCVYRKTKILFEQIQEKYHQYNIEQKPFVIIKADAGTYGMAVMSVRDPEELTQLNRKQRNNMAMRKGGQSVNHVIIQEGVPTYETIGPDQAVAEPVIYMIGQNVVGGFYRVHKSRALDENLNSPGMEFEQLAFSECCNIPDQRLNNHNAQNQFYVYSVIARLGLLATCRERAGLFKK
jgi:glutamate--cysteine ligase